MNKPYHSEVYKGHFIDLYQDTDPMNPWDNFDHVGLMACGHKRYTFPNDEDVNFANFSGWGDVEEYIADELKGLFIQPVSLLDHSTVWVKLGSFNDPWDSGQLGFLYTTREKIKKVWGWERLTKKRKETIQEALRQEFEEYAAYVEGDVTGYSVLDHDGTGEIDSCWGYFGRAGRQMAIEDAQDLIDWHLNVVYHQLSLLGDD